MTSLCKEYYQFMLAQAVLIGTSMGLLLLPGLACVSQYFSKKRGAAMGITIAGSSIGGVVYPIALSKLLNDSSVGFGWSVRIVAFMSLPFLAFACFAIKPRLPPRKTNFFIAAALKDRTFILLVVSLFVMLFGMFTPLFYIPSYAVSRGIDPTLASYMVALINAASTPGRIIPGILSDKFGKLNMYAIGGLGTGIIILCLTAAKSKAAIIVYSLIVGFFSGTIISGGMAALTLCLKDPRDAGTYMGMGLGLSSIAALVGPPIDGALLDKYGGFLEISIVSGVLCIAGGFLVLAAKATTSKGIFGRI
jgi:MFS family permease